MVNQRCAGEIRLFKAKRRPPGADGLNSANPYSTGKIIVSAKSKTGGIVIALLVAVAIALLVWPAGEDADLMLYCGAGIRPGVEPVIEAFEEEYDVGVRTSYAGSGTLLGQISSHQSGDIYMPGAEHYVDRAIEEGLADGGTKSIVSYFVPVIFVRAGNPKGIKSLEDLWQRGLRIGLGDPRACAVGKRTLKIFEKNEIPYSAVEPNVVYQSGTVNELGVAVEMGSVDAVIMWDANARNFLEHGEIVPIPPERNLPSTIPIVRLVSSRHPERAAEFIEFITSQRAREMFRERGYTVALNEDRERTEED
mgnify:FL=1